MERAISIDVRKGDCVRKGSIPEVILLNATDSQDIAHLSSRTYNLDTDLSVDLDRGVFVVGELRWGGVGIVIDVLRNQLEAVCEYILHADWD